MSRLPWQNHNHITRDIKERGICPSCDYFLDVQEAMDNITTESIGEILENLIDCETNENSDSI